MDFNKLKNYNFKNTAEKQLLKIKEEIHEFWWEVHTKDKDKQIQEGLDVVTAMLNYLNKLGMTNKDYEKHLMKLEDYKKNKYSR